jgi:hypothetical protein
MLAPCGPHDLAPLADLLFLNDGSGGFTLTGEEHGVATAPPAAATDVRLFDADVDGDLDLLVANDGAPNYLFVNDGSGHFEERGLERGLAYDELGRPAGTGALALLDVSGDGLLDVVAAGDGGEPDVIYEARGAGQFAPGHAAASHAFATRGARSAALLPVDLDNDGDVELLGIRGERFPQANASGTGTRFAQTARLFEREGGVLTAVLETGTPLDEAMVGRSAAAGDLDLDGDLDLVVTRLRTPPLILVNLLDEGAEVAMACWVRLAGVEAHGARVTATVAGRDVVRLDARHGGRSLSDDRVHIGLGLAAQADSVTVHWPDGTVELIGTVEAESEVTVRYGAGVIERRWVTGGMR